MELPASCSGSSRDAFFNSSHQIGTAGDAAAFKPLMLIHEIHSSHRLAKVDGGGLVSPSGLPSLLYLE